MGLRIKELIKEKGYSMQEFAEILEITRDTLTRNINGNPTIETLEKIASKLNVDIIDLFEKPYKDNISGFIKVKGKIEEINSIEDIEKLLDELKKNS
ncbi:helix-turn-helix domain-containing protein [Dysgonomonas massiliensis]|uniref:helix-turn-helix domain-containing protein n=1 Tax=Dysgonomonas massiliensis TaxID=2040292 RepID=UPI000C77D752|nr:helix-turn-helix transcriptional regulator [Dysgonomonas massiliensis]